MATIGELLDVPKEFEWKIDNFFSLSEEKNIHFCSPSFSYADESWYLCIYPNGDLLYNSTAHIGVRLCRKSSFSPPISLTWTLSLKTSDGRKDHERQCSSAVFDDDWWDWGVVKFLERSTLSEKKSELVPSDVLTLVCSFEYFSKTPDGDGRFVTVNCSHCKIPFHHKYVSLHEQKCLKKPIRSQTCQDVVKLRKSLDRGCQTETVKVDESLIQDYKKVLLYGKNHDFILKIGDKELRAHQDILSARSHVFESMLNHDMTEKNSGFIEVPDCDHRAMEQFLLYVYCGKVEALDESIMCKLYYIADKYDTRSLKEECCDFIKKSLSFTNVCEIIKLALKHSDSTLLEYAKEYFRENMLDILRTVEWQCFLKDNPIVGNELLIKSLEKREAKTKQI